MLSRSVRYIAARNAGKVIPAAIAALFLSVWIAPRAQAQQRSRNDSNGPTDLALQNLSQVGATATQIKAILMKDAGLMVELKRWVAKDATDHGQIVGDSDLSDFAIFDRLGSDVQFRSIATLLLQRYGYLMPKLNPESDQAKEQELLRIERTKWMAQAQEEQRAQERQKAAQDLQKTATCNNSSDRACDNNSSNPLVSPAQSQFPGQGRQIEAPSMETAPPDRDLPTAAP